MQSPKHPGELSPESTYSRWRLEGMRAQFFRSRGPHYSEVAAAIDYRQNYYARTVKRLTGVEVEF